MKWLLCFLAMPVVAAAECHKELILSLHPTQMDVGYREVTEKLEKIQRKSAKKLEEYIEKNPAPVVVGPQQQLFIYDHQHFARALHDAGIEKMCIAVDADLSSLTTTDFWKELEKRNWVYLFDNQDQAVTPDQLPPNVTRLQDDPYRSLAWQVREQGGYEKTETPFAEFQWAHFFRTRVSVGTTDADFDTAVATALGFAHSKDAKNLPGWTP
jgi:hypothetical protein